MVSRLDDFSGICDTGDAGYAIFSSYDGSMDEHASASLDDAASERYHHGHRGIDGITYQYFTFLELKDILFLFNHMGSAADQSCTGWLSPVSSHRRSGYFLFLLYGRDDWLVGGIV